MSRRATAMAGAAALVLAAGAGVLASAAGLGVTSKRLTSLTVPVLSLEINNAGGGGTTLGKPEKGDVVRITFPRAVDTGTMCSGWNGTAMNGNNDVTVRLVNGAGGANDTLTVLVTSCGTFRFGSIDLGDAGYVSSDTDFKGSGGNAASVAFDAAKRVLTVTLGGLSPNNLPTIDAAKTAEYSPHADIRYSGTSDSVSTTTGTAKHTGVHF